MKHLISETSDYILLASIMKSFWYKRAKLTIKTIAVQIRGTGIKLKIGPCGPQFI